MARGKRAEYQLEMSYKTNKNSKLLWWTTFNLQLSLEQLMHAKKLPNTKKRTAQKEQRQMFTAHKGSKIVYINLSLSKKTHNS